MWKARSSEESGHKAFLKDFGGKVFIVNSINGKVSQTIERQISSERDLLMKLPQK